MATEWCVGVCVSPTTPPPPEPTQGGERREAKTTAPATKKPAHLNIHNSHVKIFMFGCQEVILHPPLQLECRMLAVAFRWMGHMRCIANQRGWHEGVAQEGASLLRIVR